MRHVNMGGVIANILAGQTAAKLAPVIVREGSMISPSEAAYARLAGPASAAWLLWPRRKSLRVAGAVDFDYPTGARLPPWFVVAMRCLSQRKKWEVSEVWKERGKRAYRVTWLGGRQQ